MSPTETIASAALALLLAAVAIVDARTKRIPDAVNAALFASGLGATYALGRDLAPALLAAAIGYSAIVLLNYGYRLWRGRDGMGLGDAKLLGAAGAWIGWQGLPFVALLAASAGIVYVAALRLAGRDIPAQHELPFGPFLCFGVGVVWTVLVLT